MFETHEPPGGGNWGWLAAVVTGAIAGVQAIFHKRKPRRNIPERNADEIFERLGYLERDASESKNSDARLWGQITAIKDSLEDIQRQAIMKEDLREFEVRIKRMMEGRA